MGVRIVTEVSHDQEVTIRKKAIQKTQLPPYDGFGGNMRLKTKVSPYPDLFRVLKNLTKTASWLFWSLLEERDYLTNMCVFKVDNPVDARRVTLGYRELSTHSLVIRESRQHYMINPKVYLPDFNEFEAVANKWDQLREGADE